MPKRTRKVSGVIPIREGRSGGKGGYGRPYLARLLIEHQGRGVVIGVPLGEMILTVLRLHYHGRTAAHDRKPARLVHLKAP